MDNYEAIAYARVALRELKEENTEVTEQTLRSRMLYLMDMNSESEIIKRLEGK